MEFLDYFWFGSLKELRVDDLFPEKFENWVGFFGLTGI